MAALRLALAGAGAIGQRHAALVMAHPQCELCAVVDPTDAARAFAERCSAPWYPSLEALLDDGPAARRPDGVIIATPNHLHLAGALLCAGHGVPALIEKPVAATLAEALQLADVLAMQPVPMLVGHHRRHGAVLRRAFEAIRDGLIGRVVSVMGSAQFYKPASYFAQAAWRSQPGGGPVLINLIHEMDSLRLLCGDIVSVQAQASSAVRGLPVEDTAVMTLRFASGALGTFTLSDTAAAPLSWEQTTGENPAYACYPSESCCTVAGTRGALALPALRLWRHDAALGEPGWNTPFAVQSLAVQPNDPLVAQLDHFCEVARGEAAPIITVSDAARSLAVVQAVQASIGSGRTVAVGEVASSEAALNI